ncbi:hypothetical protein MMC07_006918 [Pseudocyphellaria aurata]|nr:hypothetical protein [Pseudocyphellaria aurata]
MSVSPAMPASPAMSASPTWKEILLPVENRIEAICEEESDALIAIRDVCFGLSKYIQHRSIIPDANGNIEQSYVGTYQDLDADVFDAFDRIERINWQGQDLADVSKYMRDLGHKTIEKENALETGKSEKNHP